jgi:hypothetical protein
MKNLATLGLAPALFSTIFIIVLQRVMKVTEEREKGGQGNRKRGGWIGEET